MPMVSRPYFLPQLPSWGRKALFALALSGICFAFAFPVLWLILTSLRPESGVYYVHRGTEFTLGKVAERELGAAMDIIDAGLGPQRRQDQPQHREGEREADSGQRQRKQRLASP